MKSASVVLCLACVLCYPVSVYLDQLVQCCIVHGVPYLCDVVPSLGVGTMSEEDSISIRPCESSVKVSVRTEALGMAILNPRACVVISFDLICCFANQFLIQIGSDLEMKVKAIYLLYIMHTKLLFSVVQKLVMPACHCYLHM